MSTSRRTSACRGPCECYNSKATKGSATTKSSTSRSTATIVTSVAASSIGYAAEAEDCAVHEDVERQHRRNDEAAAVARRVAELADPLPAAWEEFGKEFQVQVRIWESQAMARAFADARSRGNAPDAESLELQQQEAAMVATIEATVRASKTDSAEPVLALEAVMQKAKDACLFNVATIKAGIAVLEGSEANKARRTLTQILSEEHHELSATRLEALVSSCDLGDAKLEYRARQVLRMGLRGALRTPGASPRKSAKVRMTMIK